MAWIGFCTCIIWQTDMQHWAFISTHNLMDGLIECTPWQEQSRIQQRLHHHQPTAQIGGQTLFRAKQFYWVGRHQCCIVSSHTMLLTWSNLTRVHFLLHLWHLEIWKFSASLWKLTKTPRKFPCQIPWSWIWFGSLWRIIYGSLVHRSPPKMIPHYYQMRRLLCSWATKRYQECETILSSCSLTCQAWWYICPGSSVSPRAIFCGGGVIIMCEILLILQFVSK